MLGFVLVISLALAAQVVPAGSPYGDVEPPPAPPTSGTPDASAAPAADAAAPPSTPASPSPSGIAQPPASASTVDAAATSDSVTPIGADAIAPIGSDSYPPPGAGTGTRNGQPRPFAPQRFGQAESDVAPSLNFSESPSQRNSADLAASPATTGMIKPSVLVKELLAPRRDSQLTGSPVYLIDIVSGASTRAEQAQRIDAYWDMAASVADYYLSLREKEELQTLQARGSRSGDVWQRAQSEVDARVKTSLQGARAAQMRLAVLMGTSDQLPLPGDLLHCGTYYPKYEEVFAGRPSVEARELAVLLPLRYAELQGAAFAVVRADDWMGKVASGATDDGEGPIRSLELFALRRRAFVQIARDYNRRIARYAELAAPGEIGAEPLVRMLIKTSGTSTATGASSPVSPATREARQDDAAARQPLTFENGAGWESANTAANRARRDGAVTPAVNEAPSQPRRERSLMVPPGGSPKSRISPGK